MLGLTVAEGVADDVGGPWPAKSVSCVERQNGTIFRKKSERETIYSLEKN